MSIQNKIYYWSPFISSVATVEAVIKSAYSINAYSKNKYTPYIINVAGEWNSHLNKLYDKKIRIINLTNSKIIDNKNYSGFIKSRFIYIYIFFIALIPLIKLLKKNPPNFFIAQLITSLPLFINFFISFKTHFIMRISGLPKLNILRHLFWKITFKNIYALTCPTNETKEYLIEKNILDRKKLFTLYDPIISTKEIVLKKKEIYEGQLDLKKTFIAIGRLTRQKNFLFLISSFIKFNEKKYYNLLIIGEGEDYQKLQKYIDKNRLTKNVKIINYQKNIYKYLKNCKCFVMSSLWEDPGFVLVEASYSGIPIISTDCKSGPKEILNDGKNGLLFRSNNMDSFLKTIRFFDTLSADKILTLKINAKKKSREFSIFNHFRNLNKILNLNYK